MISLAVRNFDLDHTLNSGQVFRFVSFGDHYLLHTGDCIFTVRQKGERIFFEGVEEEFIARFFRLDDDMEEIYREIRKDPFIGRAIDLSHGLRLIRQDPWECLASFLCSSVKNIQHIKCIIEHLCRHYGKALSMGNYRGYGFPPPERIDKAPDLLRIKAGFRARYLAETSKLAKSMDLGELRKWNYWDAREKLMEFPGVGEKIADCVLLYSLEFTQAFPVDTWIRRAMRLGYFGGKELPDREIQELAWRHFGRYAGYAQQYLYYYARNRTLENVKKGDMRTRGD